MLYLFRHSMHNMESVFPIMRQHFLHIKDSGLCICIAVCELRRANTGLRTAAVVSELFTLSEKDTKFYYLKAANYNKGEDLHSYPKKNSQGHFSWTHHENIHNYIILTPFNPTFI